jgi:hypothetical protein
VSFSQRLSSRASELMTDPYGFPRRGKPAELAQAACAERFKQSV